MKTAWKKIYIRRDCDIPTANGIILTAYAYFWRHGGQKQEYLFGYSKDGHFHYFGKNFNRFGFGRNLYKKYYNTPNQIKIAYLKGKKFLRLTENKTQSWQKKFKKPTQVLLSGALSDFEKDFVWVNNNYSILPWWALEAWQYDFEKILSQLIAKKNLSGRYSQILAGATRPWKPTALTDLKQDFKRGVSVKTLIHKYQFLRSWTAIWNKPIDQAWIKASAEQKPQTVTKLALKELYKLLSPNSGQRAFFALAPYIVFFKDWRDDLRRRHAFAWQFLWQKIAKNLKVKPFDLGYFTITEIKKALEQGKIDKRVLKQRKIKPFLILIDRPKLKIKIITGKFPKQYIKTIKLDQKQHLAPTIKGIIGQPGKVTGRVRIIAGTKDLNKIKFGEILVANTTHPDYLAAMKKAAAFVTDEGGITSHAAIVARELKIPCIVGTKTATKTLKNGDLVEADANKGLVRKL